MSLPSTLYGPSLALFTDLYQITMAYSVWKAQKTEEEAVFHLFFRKNPFKGAYAVACGLEYAIDYLENARFSEDDLNYLESLKGANDVPLFEKAFLEELAGMKLSLDLDAVKEGTVVFPHEPLLRVKGPIIQCMLAESPLLNIINFQTLLATKAARIVNAAKGEPVLDFGLRRAQGIDGALSAARAAFVGGCSATSNVLAGKLFDIPVRGTHAHSWVMLFDTEKEAFLSYADALPQNCVFLVDTYDTLEGVKHAIEVGKLLREKGFPLLGIRLDSGDLAYLSIEARKLLDESGFADCKIYATNDLDEHTISSLKTQGAKVAVWGVGTRLITAQDDPALGGVYKLGAIRKGPETPWTYRVKLSEQSVKTSIPGVLQVRRYFDEHGFYGDAIYNEAESPTPEIGRIIDPMDITRQKKIEPSLSYEDLLIPIIRNGETIYKSPKLPEIQERTKAQLKALSPGLHRLLYPHQYPVGLEPKLYALRTQLILEARNHEDVPPLETD